MVIEDRVIRRFQRALESSRRSGTDRIGKNGARRPSGTENRRRDPLGGFPSGLSGNGSGNRKGPLRIRPGRERRSGSPDRHLRSGGRIQCFCISEPFLHLFSGNSESGGRYRFWREGRDSIWIRCSGDIECRRFLKIKSFAKNSPERKWNPFADVSVRFVRMLTIPQTSWSGKGSSGRSRSPNFPGNIPMPRRPPVTVSPLVIGIRCDRNELRRKITLRLQNRLESGMIDEVQRLHDRGIAWKRLESFGLEYRYISLYLQQKITREEMFQTLNTRIHQFAKRQETWFRRMERCGVRIHWIEGADEDAALGLMAGLTE